ncbi:hypothetical protein BLOT_016606 [Blomia tropicalis]|nr:hypothetical protein BLOT_016606 [Blomia tropicalis]
MVIFTQENITSYETYSLRQSAESQSDCQRPTNLKTAFHFILFDRHNRNGYANLSPNSLCLIAIVTVAKQTKCHVSIDLQLRKEKKEEAIQYTFLQFLN